MTDFATYRALQLLGLMAALGSSGCSPDLGPAMQSLEGGAHAEAAAYLEALTAEHPDCARCFFLLGVARANLSEAAKRKPERKQLGLAGVDAFTKAHTLDPNLHRAAVYAAILGSDGTARLDGFPEKAQTQFAALRWRLYAQASRRARAKEAEAQALTNADLSDWKPLIAADDTREETFVVVSEGAQVLCPPGPDASNCKPLEVGTVLNGTSADDKHVQFVHHFRAERQGWMPAKALQRRRFWDDRAFRVVRTRKSRVPNAERPWIWFDKPPACPPARQGDLYYWAWMMNQRKNRFLRGRERASLKVISKGHKTGRARMFGGCREPIAVKWAVVSFQEERTETRRVARDAVAPVRGSVREERARVSQIAQHWPPQLRSHLLRSELAKGLPFSAALSAVGVRSTQIERTYGTDTLREVFLHEGDADAVTLTFVDGHLESWKREALDLDDMVFDKDLPEGEF